MWSVLSFTLYLIYTGLNIRYKLIDPVLQNLQDSSVTLTQSCLNMSLSMVRYLFKSLNLLINLIQFIWLFCTRIFSFHQSVLQDISWLTCTIYIVWVFCLYHENTWGFHVMWNFITLGFVILFPCVSQIFFAVISGIKDFPVTCYMKCSWN